MDEVKAGQPSSSSLPPPVDEKQMQATAPVTTNTDVQDNTTTPEPKHRPQRLASFKDYLRVFQYATKWDFVAYAGGFFASIGAGITLPLMNVVFGKFVGSFSDFGTNGIDKDRFRNTLDKLALYMFFLFLARLLLNYTNKFAFRMIGIRLSSAIRLHYLSALLSQNIHVLDSMPSGLATSTITSSSNTLQLGISEKLGVLVEYNATLISALIIAFTKSWVLSLVTSSAILFIMLTLGTLLPFIIAGHGRFALSEAKSSEIASESMASIRMIAACGAEKRMSTKYAKFVEEAKKHSQFISPLIALQFGLIFFGIFSAFGLAFWYGTKSVVEKSNGIDGVETIVVVLLSIMMIVFSLERTSTPLLAIGKATVAACQFFTVIDAPQPNKGHLKDPDVSASEDIIMDNIVFAYPTRPHVKVLDGLDLRIEAGKMTAVVGASGSGKSTLVGLIQRWYTLKDQYTIAKTVEKKKKKSKKNSKSSDRDIDEEETEEEGVTSQSPEDSGPPVQLGGSITTCCHPLDEIELNWWRSQIGLVTQEPFLFNETIYVNVSYGLVGTQWENETEEMKRALVKQACIEAFADEFIDKLPSGYDELVGDSGAKLSGGQRQRIAIARAIVRKPKILILDEATSAIDVRSERIVQAALDQVAQNRTTIVIAHRLSTIKKADRIVVLKKGKVVESGTHQSLVGQDGGVYFGLVKAQELSLGGAAEAKPEIEQDEGERTSLTREKSLAKSETDAATLKPAPKRRDTWNSFWRFFYENQSHRYLMLSTIFFAACAGAAGPLQAWLFAKLIVVFQYTGEKLLQQGRFWSLIWVMLAIGVGLAYFGTFFFSTWLASIIRAKYQQQYFEAVLYQKIAFFDDEDHSQGTMATRMGQDAEILEGMGGANMAAVYIAVFNITGSIIIAFIFGWKLALVSTSIVLPVLLASSYWRLKYELKFDELNAAVFAESSKFASESIAAFRTVTSLTLEASICDRFAKLCKGHVMEAYKKARWVSLLFALSDSVTIACQALIFYYGGRLILKGEYGLESFFVVFQAIMQAGEAGGQSLSYGPNLAQVISAIKRFREVRESRLRNDDSESTKKPGSSKGGMKIELQNMHFKYPTRDIPVFRGLSLTIQKGQFAALVGASGSGKSSLISLLERFYDLNKGRILCDDEDISSMNIFEYRKYLSLVAQEPTLYKGTIRDNVILGVDETAVTDEQIHQACRDASIHDFIVSLPEGYNTDIGSRGVSLSGGQKQRVAIARALIRNPEILLLDEATSSLDSESEKLVQAAFERAGKGRTMVVVAHRLATVQNADIIFVLGDGQLLEQGSHSELLQKQGVYWQMCQSQALDR